MYWFIKALFLFIKVAKNAGIKVPAFFFSYSMLHAHCYLDNYLMNFPVYPE